MNVDAAEIDTFFDLCRDERRRAVLALLAERRGSTTVCELANALVERDDQSRGVAVESNLDRLELSLHHVHLPKLAAAGLVEYDSERQRLEPTAAIDRLSQAFSALLAADTEIESAVE